MDVRRQPYNPLIAAVFLDVGCVKGHKESEPMNEDACNHLKLSLPSASKPSLRWNGGAGNRASSVEQQTPSQLGPVAASAVRSLTAVNRSLSNRIRLRIHHCIFF